jgi:putative ABC transport system permease protein
MNTMGLGFNITDDGIRRLNPQYEPAVVLAYVAESADVDAVISQISTQYGAMISAISNARAAFQSAFGTYTSVVAIFAVSIFAIMGLIVVLILTLITGATIVRRRREFGIEKALGFTAWQLICQVSIGFLPVAVVGALIGGVLGWFEANPLMSLLFRSIGIMKVDFYLPPLSIPVICAVIAILTIAVSMLSAGRVRKISPCVLVSE